MKKFLLTCAMLLFVFTIDAKAQLPFPGQSMPQQVDVFSYSTTRPDGTVDWTCGLDHYGSSIAGSAGYDLYVSRTIYKSVSGQWVQVGISDEHAQYFPNASYHSPNQTFKTVWSHDILLEEGCGVGTYMSKVLFYAYNPFSTPPAKIFFTQSWVVFNVYANQ